MPVLSLGEARCLSEDPVEWTPEIDSVTADNSTHKSTLRQSGYYSSPFTVLHPRTSDRTVPPMHLLGGEMTSLRTLPWAREYELRGNLGRRPYQIDLTRFILRQERTTLERVDLYKAVFLFLFSYDGDLSFFRGFAERWNYVTNTLILEDREMMISPWDLCRLSGLPILDRPYDEYSLRDSDLYSRLPDGSYYHPASLRCVYQIYSGLLSTKRSRVSFATWLRHFTDRVCRPCREFSSPSDPFGIGRAVKELVEPYREYILSVADNALVGDHEQRRTEALSCSRELKAAEQPFSSICQDLRASEDQLAQLRLLYDLRRPSEIESGIVDVVSARIVHQRQVIVRLERDSLVVVGERRRAYGVAQGHLADFARDVGLRRGEAERLYLQIGGSLSYPLRDLVS